MNGSNSDRNLSEFRVADQVTSETRRRTALEVAALRTLDLIAPGQAVRWAAERAAERDASPQVVAIAALTEDVRADDIASLIDDLLETEGAAPLDDERAGLIVAKMLAQDIVDGTIAPAVGARTIWWDVVGRVPTTRDRLADFVGLASEWEDNPEHREAYDAEIVSAAHGLITSPDMP